MRVANLMMRLAVLMLFAVSIRAGNIEYDGTMSEDDVSDLFSPPFTSSDGVQCWWQFTKCRNFGLGGRTETHGSSWNGARYNSATNPASNRAMSTPASTTDGATIWNNKGTKQFKVYGWECNSNAGANYDSTWSTTDDATMDGPAVNEALGANGPAVDCVMQHPWLKSNDGTKQDWWCQSGKPICCPCVDGVKDTAVMDSKLDWLKRKWERMGGWGGSVSATAVWNQVSTHMRDCVDAHCAASVEQIRAESRLLQTQKEDDLLDLLATASKDTTEAKASTTCSKCADCDGDGVVGPSDARKWSCDCWGQLLLACGFDTTCHQTQISTHCASGLELLQDQKGTSDVDSLLESSTKAAVGWDCG